MSIHSDRDNPKVADVIRLLVLDPTATPSQFKVIAYDEKLDDAVTAPGNLLSVGLGRNPFSYALIEMISENEGFDDLTFTVVPEPSYPSLSVLGSLAIAILGSRHRRCRDGRLGPLPLWRAQSNRMNRHLADTSSYERSPLCKFVS